MRKDKMVNEIIDNVTGKQFTLLRVYGVPMGVGYDYVLYVNFKGNRSMSFDGHATSRAWDLHRHLRPDQYVFDDYKGINAPLRYKESVRRYLEEGDGLFYYLMRYSKDKLTEIYNLITA